MDSNKLINILDSYEDFELAFLRKYKLDIYLKETSEFVLTYLNKRGITERKAKILIEEINKKKIEAQDFRCPRCKSKKIRQEEVEWTNTAYQTGIADEVAIIDGVYLNKTTYKKQEVCNICGYWISDPNNEKPQKRSFLEKLLNIILD